MKKLLSHPYFLLLFLLFTNFINFQAQNGPPKHWDKTLGGSGKDNLTAMKQTADGGYIICGWSDSGLSGDKSEASRGGRDYWIVKINAFGGKQWDRTYGGNNPSTISKDEATQVLQMADGSFIVAGRSAAGVSGDKTANPRGGHDFWVLKLDPAGNKIWDKAYGGSFDDNLTSMQKTTDGNIILGGSSLSGFSGEKTTWGNGGYDYWLVKIDLNGNKLWDKSYGKSGNDYFTSLHQTADGGYILGGYTESQPIMGLSDYWIIKVDATGTVQWDKIYTGDGEDLLWAIRQTSDGGYILGGTSDSNIFGDKGDSSRGGYDYWVMKTDNNGNKIWDRTLGGGASERFASLQQTSDGGYIVGGGADSNISGDKTQIMPGFWIVKLTSSGITQWDRSLTGQYGSSSLTCLLQSSDGGYVLGGFSSSLVGVDKTEPNQGDWDYWIVKLYGGAVGIEEEHVNGDLTVFPNPSKGAFRVIIPRIFQQDVEVRLLDVLGRTLLQRKLKTFNGIIEIQQLNLNQGLYVLEVNTQEEKYSTKVLIE